MLQTTNQVAMTYPVNLYPMMAVSSLIYEKLENKEGFPLASWWEQRFIHVYTDYVHMKFWEGTVSLKGCSKFERVLSSGVTIQEQPTPTAETVENWASDQQIHGFKIL